MQSASRVVESLWEMKITVLSFAIWFSSWFSRYLVNGSKALLGSSNTATGLSFANGPGRQYFLILAAGQRHTLFGKFPGQQCFLLIRLPPALMIFVTAHYKYAADTYELHIFYIPKNQLAERLPLRDILFIEKEGKNVLFHTVPSAGLPEQDINGRYIRRVRKTLTDVYEELHTDEFCFIERGYIVNLRHVAGISRADCILTDRTRLPVSQSRLSDFKKRLNEYWKNKV